MSVYSEVLAVYELKPITRQKSFYGKAIVFELKNGDKVLRSYDTLIMTKKKNGELIKHWEGWSATTGKHIKAFSGLNKKQYFELKNEKID